MNTIHSSSSTMLLLDSRPCFKFNKTFLINSPPSFQILQPKRNFYFKTDYRKTCCKAVFSDDAPFAAAIGACMLTSLVFPIPVATEEEEEESAITSTDTRLAVMGIMSFIPYFNWLSWIFALFDTGNRRYAIYSLVYLAPYLRSNLSISPEESWLPIASILFCIVHIQLEASIKIGDIEGFQLFRSVMDQQSSSTKKKGRLNQQEMSKGSKNEKKNLLSAEERSRDIGGWEDSQRPLEYKQRLKDSIDDDGEKRSKH